MKLSVFGLGYVGSVCSACLADEGHVITGVDSNSDKVGQINSGKAPLKEPGLDELIASTVREGRLRATTNVAAAITESEASIVCVGTPSRANGAIDLRQVTGVMRQIGEALRTKQTVHTVILRSTVPPSTSQRCRQILAEAAGHSRFNFFYNPEFLREGRSIEEFRHPALTVVGTDKDKSCDPVQFLWENRGGKLVITTIETAELVKYSCNAFHATKVAFANELGRIARGFGVNGQEVMHILCQDDRLNISAVYLRPGFAFGGSCLPKDLRAMVAESNLLGVDNPLLEAVLKSNSSHLASSVKIVIEAMQKADKPKPRLLMVGLAFKAGTDDLRESPAVALAEKLLSRGIQLEIYDPYIQPENLIGKNRLFVDYELPEMASLLQSSLSEAMERADIVVLTQADRKTLAQLIAYQKPHHIVVDLSGDLQPGKENYFSLVA